MSSLVKYGNGLTHGVATASAAYLAFMWVDKSACCEGFDQWCSSGTGASSLHCDPVANSYLNELRMDERLREAAAVS